MQTARRSYASVSARHSSARATMSLISTRRYTRSIGYAAGDEPRSVEHQIAGICDHRRDPERREGVTEQLELAPRRHLTPVDDGDLRRAGGAAPVAVAGHQRVEQQRDRGVVPRLEPLAESAHQRLVRKDLRQPLAVPGARRRLRVVLGELEGIGQQKCVGPCGGAGHRVTGVHANEPDLRLAQTRARRTAPSVPSRPRRRARRASTSFPPRATTRRSSSPVRKNGRRNGQSSRPPKVRRCSRMRSARPAHGLGAALAAHEIAPRIRGILVERHQTGPGREGSFALAARPTMSAQRGHVCCARPLTARSITSADIFSTTISK